MQQHHPHTRSVTEEEKRAAGEGVLSRLPAMTEEITRVVHGLSPGMLTWHMETGSPSIGELISQAIHDAMAAKELLRTDVVESLKIKTLSFVSPEEAATTLRSILEALEAGTKSLSSAEWDTSVRILGDEKFRGDTRREALGSLLMDIDACRAQLAYALQEAAGSPEQAIGKKLSQ